MPSLTVIHLYIPSPQTFLIHPLSSASSVMLLRLQTSTLPSGKLLGTVVPGVTRLELQGIQTPAISLADL